MSDWGFTHYHRESENLVICDELVCFSFCSSHLTQRQKAELKSWETMPAFPIFTEGEIYLFASQRHLLRDEVRCGFNQKYRVLQNNPSQKYVKKESGFLGG